MYKKIFNFFFLKKNNEKQIGLNPELFSANEAARQGVLRFTKCGATCQEMESALRTMGKAGIHFASNNNLTQH